MAENWVIIEYMVEIISDRPEQWNRNPLPQTFDKKWRNGHKSVSNKVSYIKAVNNKGLNGFDVTRETDEVTLDSVLYVSFLWRF